MINARRKSKPAAAVFFGLAGCLAGAAFGTADDQQLAPPIESFEEPEVAINELILVNGAFRDVTYECRGGRVIINGYKNRVTLTGPCHSVAVHGANCEVEVGQTRRLRVAGAFNTVHVESVGFISAFGRTNHIRWSKGWEGKEPVILEHGSRNKVEHVAPETGG